MSSISDSLETCSTNLRFSFSGFEETQEIQIVKLLHEVVRYVCKQWFDVVSDPCFIRAHSLMSSSGYLIQDGGESLHAYYIEADNARLNVTKIQMPFPARVIGSSNGLVLLHDMTNPDIFHLMNLVTKVRVSLPPVVELTEILSYPDCATNCTGHREAVRLTEYFSSAGFAINSAGHCKVVVNVSGVKVNRRGVKVNMRVFTVGVDKVWRFIDLRGMRNTGVLRYCPLSIAGFVYWCSENCTCFALDVDTETVYQFSTPKGASRRQVKGVFISLGTTLGFMKFEQNMCSLWKLTDVKAGEWIELTWLNLRKVVVRVRRFHPSRRQGFRPFRLIDGDL